MDNSEIGRFFSIDVAQLTATLAAVEEETRHSSTPDDDAIAERLTQSLEECLHACKALEQTLSSDIPQLRGVQTRFREAIAPWFSQSWFMKHALEKPRGYAGDHLILTRLYNGEILSTGLGGYLDRFFLGTELGVSVPLRLKMVREFLIAEARSRGEMSVLNIACGPCREYSVRWDLPEECHVDVVCADSDEDALNFVQSQIIPNLPNTVQMSLVQHNALKIGNVALNEKLFGRRDVIYSVGLFDYIPDRLLLRMLSGLRESLAPGGVIYLAFKDSNYYDATPYQWLVDWYFYQRTEAECRQLLADAGYDVQSLEMTRDQTGSIINYIARLPTSNKVTTESSSELPVVME